MGGLFKMAVMRTITVMIDGIIPPQRPSQPWEKEKEASDSTETVFIPPEKVAADRTEPLAAVSVSLKSWDTEKEAPAQKNRRFRPVVWFKALSKKQKALVIIAIVAVLAALGGGTWALFKSKEKPQQAPAPVVKKEEPKPEPTFSPLTGIPVSKEQATWPVVGVMIENSPDARPQAGLKDAGVVFEAIAEGGITRFLALYQETKPDYIGPVRSVRPYYVDWLQGFDAAVAHVGGSGEALAKIRNEGVRDLDQMANAGVFQRVRNRYAPHNMYSNVAALADLSRQKGWNTSQFTGFTRKTEAPSSALTAAAIDVTISGRLYNIHYDYDAATNTYKRVMAGKPHIDERSKAQISPKAVVIMIVPYSIHADGLHSVYQTIGSGKVFIFQDGIAAEGTWEKTSAKSQITFKDTAGKSIQLNPGQTWVTATSIPSNVAFRP